MHSQEEHIDELIRDAYLAGFYNEQRPLCKSDRGAKAKAVELFKRKFPGKRASETAVERALSATQPKKGHPKYKLTFTMQEGKLVGKFEPPTHSKKRGGRAPKL